MEVTWLLEAAEGDEGYGCLQQHYWNHLKDWVPGPPGRVVSIYEAVSGRSLSPVRLG